MDIREEDTGKEFPARVGETAEIILFENPSTGYRWMAEISDGIIITESRYDAGSGRLGSGGSRHWLLQFTKPGRQQFRGLYNRPWEKTAGSAKVFDVRFSVEDKAD